MPRKPTCSQEIQDMIVGLRDAGHEWDVIATLTGKPKMACSAIYSMIKANQQHLTLAVNQQLRVRPDYRKIAEHTGRD